MKKIIYILLTITGMLYPNANFATIGHHAPITTQKVLTNGVQKSKFRTKLAASLSSIVTSIFVVAALSVLSLIIGLILLNWWLIILGVIGIALFLWFIHLISHISMR